MPRTAPYLTAVVEEIPAEQPVRRSARTEALIRQTYELFESFIEEPLIGILLNFNEVGHLQYFFLPGIAHAEAFSGFDGTNSVFLH